MSFCFKQNKKKMMGGSSKSFSVNKNAESADEFYPQKITFVSCEYYLIPRVFDSSSL